MSNHRPQAQRRQAQGASQVQLPPQTLEQACERFIDWMDDRVVAAGRGDGMEWLEVAPSGTFWLGRLACENEIRNGLNDERSERLEPCAIGVRLRPAAAGPWSMTVIVRARVWTQAPKDEPDPDRRWRRSPLVQQTVVLTADAQGGCWGRDALAAALTDAGAPGLTAEVRVDVEDRGGRNELVVELVNTSPIKVAGLADTHLYETEIEICDLATDPFELTALPDSFRYDREVPAYGINVGVEVTATGGLRTTDTIPVQTYRPRYWNGQGPEPDLSFAAMASDPLPQLTALVDALRDYDHAHWSPAALDARAAAERWSPGLRAEADHEAVLVAEELARLTEGLRLLQTEPLLFRAFILMNKAMESSSQGRNYDSWRPFQIGFLLSTIRFLIEPEEEAGCVDTVWFATGGGKTETYLGLLLTVAFFDRLTGKSVGVTAWSRFPLRLLSLQQTQRFADALAAAETVRTDEGVGGHRFALGFLVGQAGTPNRIVPRGEQDGTTPDSPGMPDRYQVLLYCPFCRDENLTMRFDSQRWTLEHHCTNSDCSWSRRALPIHVVDQEIFRFLPTVVVGTLDKAASIGMQQAMRGLVGPPRKVCPIPWHGFTYAERRATPTGCLVPGCQGGTALRDLPMDPRRFAPSLRLQDELHLLRDSLGAVDAHYEGLIDDLQRRLCGSRAKIVASSATLTGYDRQVQVLYQRQGRVFPRPGPRTGESFWTCVTAGPLRRFVAVAPRGVTLEHVSDRTLDTLQHCVRDLAADPASVCRAAGVDVRHTSELISLYGTNIVYGSTLYEVEAAGRSVNSNNTVAPINVEQLTGQTEFDEVRRILDRLENPEPDFDERIHVIAASSMLSHGVDVNRLNTMVMLGLTLTTAEYIQTTARVGRRYPGLVHVLHKIARERDAQTFRHFEQYIRQGDRFVDAIPITRRSRRVLDLTIPGVVNARTLMLREPASRQRLSTAAKLRDYIRASGLTPEVEAAAVGQLLGLTAAEDPLHHDQILEWLQEWFRDLNDPTSHAVFTTDVGPRPPMMSLRDVEATAPIHD